MKATELQLINDQLIDAYGDISINLGNNNLGDPVIVGDTCASISEYRVVVKTRKSKDIVVTTTTLLTQPVPF